MKKNNRKNKNRKIELYVLLIIALFSTGVMTTGCSQKENDANKNAQQKEIWTCPMHPQVISDRPGVCPICHMDLVKKVEAEDQTMSGEDSTNLLALSGKKQVLANVSTVVVKKEKLQNQVSAYSYLDFVENNRKTISARFNGRIEKLFVAKSGDYIKKGQALFEIYSPDLVQAQNDFLVALNKTTGANLLLDAAKKKLELFGLTSEQINKLEDTKEVNLTLTYYSPLSGTVIEKKVQEGIYVNEGNEIYDVAELSTVWDIAEVYEKDIANVKIGNPVKLHLRAYPGEEFNGKVSFIYPVINPQTRTIKVRCEFSSYNGKLKPQMYGETIFNNQGGEGLLVPVDAVIIAGKRAVVWKKIKEGIFEASNVVIGNRFEDKYQVISGLKDGDEIAATGGFLIDSESQLKTGMPATGISEDKNSQKESRKENPSNDEAKKSEGSKKQAKIFNAVCPVLGNPVSDKVKPVEYKGKLIGFCCAGCDTKFIAEPKKYMKNLSADGKIFLGK